MPMPNMPPGPADDRHPPAPVHIPTVQPPRHHPTAHEPIKPAPMRGPKQGNKGY